MNSLLIALDFDETYTADPVLWRSFVHLAKHSGHQVIIATMRYPHEGAEIESEVDGLISTIVYTGRKAKFDELKRQGFSPDIWIDDSPHWLFSNG